MRLVLMTFLPFADFGKKLSGMTICSWTAFSALPFPPTAAAAYIWTIIWLLPFTGLIAAGRAGKSPIFMRLPQTRLTVGEIFAAA